MKALKQLLSERTFFAFTGFPEKAAQLQSLKVMW